jgi:hypothetical protein
MGQAAAFHVVGAQRSREAQQGEETGGAAHGNLGKESKTNYHSIRRFAGYGQNLVPCGTLN